MVTAATSERCWCPFLIEAGHDVVGLDAGWYDGCDFGAAAHGATSRAPATSATQRPEDLAGFDAVVNLAAISNDPVGHLNPEATYSVNAHGAAHLAQVAKRGRRPALPLLLLLQPLRRRGRGAVTEESDFNPVTPYGESKVWPSS